MNDEQERDKSDSSLLTSQDRADGFSVGRDDRGNITVSRWGRPMAWFATTVTEELIVTLLKCCKDCEPSDNKQVGTK